VTDTVEVGVRLGDFDEGWLRAERVRLGDGEAEGETEGARDEAAGSADGEAEGAGTTMLGVRAA
jgi:hypothetical protein